MSSFCFSPRDGLFFWRSASSLTSAEIWHQEFQTKTLTWSSKIFKSGWVGDVVIWTELTSPGFASSWQFKLDQGCIETPGWDKLKPGVKKHCFHFCVSPNQKLYTNRARQLGLILRGISFNPQLQVLLVLPGKEGFMKILACVASKLLETHTNSSEQEQEPLKLWLLVSSNGQNRRDWTELTEENRNTSERNHTSNRIILLKKKIPSHVLYFRILR